MTAGPAGLTLQFGRPYAGTSSVEASVAPPLRRRYKAQPPRTPAPARSSEPGSGTATRIWALPEVMRGVMSVGGLSPRTVSPELSELIALRLTVPALWAVK